MYWFRTDRVASSAELLKMENNFVPGVIWYPCFTVGEDTLFSFISLVMSRTKYTVALPDDIVLATHICLN